MSTDHFVDFLQSIVTLSSILQETCPVPPVHATIVVQANVPASLF